MTQIISNVRDGRHGWIGTWEVEDTPIDWKRLGPSDLGRTVIYRDVGRAEAGTLTSWRNGIIYARYSTGETAAGAVAEHLVFAIKTIGASAPGQK